MDHGLEQRPARIDVAGLALLRADVLVVDSDDAVLGMHDALDLVVIGDLHEGREIVTQGELDQVLKRLLGQDPRGQEDRRGAHLLGGRDLLFARDEVLLEQRQIGEPGDLTQHVVVAAKPASGHHRDARRADRRVLGHDLRDRALAHELTAVGVLALDLHDDRQVAGEQRLSESARHSSLLTHVPSRLG